MATPSEQFYVAIEDIDAASENMRKRCSLAGTLACDQDLVRA
jgi:hypothetical protein